MGQGNGQGHIFRSFVRGIAEHHALIAGADFFIVVLVAALGFVGFIHAHGNIRGLFVDGQQHPAGSSVKAVFGTVIADVHYGLPGNFGNIHIAAGGNFPYHMDLASGYQGFTSNPGIGVLGDDGIQDCVGNLVGNLIRMAFRYRFRCKKLFHSSSLSKKNTPH